MIPYYMQNNSRCKAFSVIRFFSFFWHILPLFIKFAYSTALCLPAFVYFGYFAFRSICGENTFLYFPTNLCAAYLAVKIQSYIPDTSGAAYSAAASNSPCPLWRLSDKNDGTTPDIPFPLSKNSVWVLPIHPPQADTIAAFWGECRKYSWYCHVWQNFRWAAGPQSEASKR